MAYNHQQFPFWDFVHSMDYNGAGVDHAAGGFPFGGPPFDGHHGGPAGHPHPPPPPGGFAFGGPTSWASWGPGPWGGRGGHRGRHGHRRDGSHGPHGRRGSRGPSPDGDRPEDPEGEGGEALPHGRRGSRGCGRHGRGGGHGPRGGWGGRERGGRGPFGRGFGGRGGSGAPEAFDLNGLIAALSSHPLAQTLRNYAEQAGFSPDGQQTGTVARDAEEEDEDENGFIPPVDIFSTEKTFVLHVALPGARKEDVGVNWDDEKGVLNLAGVVYRQGDEAFLQSLAQSERTVGVFERTVKLPPGSAEKEEIDGDNITAKLEDGVLVVTVPKVEKEWTEVKRVDIE